jgi:ATP-dependent Lhr-like helicase
MLLRAGRSERRGRLRAVRRHRTRFLPAGRWALLRTGAEPGAEDPIRAARLLLRRWGVVVREMLARETRLPPWRTLLGGLRTLEARGEIRGGRFVAGLVGEQFALPEAVETLRAIRRRAREEEVVVVSAADPLNLVGVLLPGPRIAPAAREVIAFRDGVPVESGELGEVLSRLGRRAPAAG